MKTPVLRPRGTTFGREVGHNTAQIRQGDGFILARKRDRGPVLQLSRSRCEPVSAALESACSPPPRQPGGKAGLAKPFHHLVEMRAVAGFDHDFEQRALGRQIGEGALMRDLDDIGAGFGQ